MSEESQQSVKAKVVIVDPVSMLVVWGNEASTHDLSASVDPSGMPVGELLAVLGDGLSGAVALAASTGATQQLSTNLVSTAKGSLAIATSVYRLPDGSVLIVSENDWRPRHERPDAPRRAARRGR